MILLASQSPRRKAILKFIGLSFRVVKPLNIRESHMPGETPAKMVRRLALEKAGVVSRRYPSQWVLGADTVVFCKKKIFGKPRNREEATRMLKMLQGRTHEVWTGVAFLGPRTRPKIHVEKTKVTFARIPAKEMFSYLKSREPYDKAGSYDIQGTAREWIEKWEGDYFNILGLPVVWLIPAINRIKKRINYSAKF